MMKIRINKKLLFFFLFLSICISLFSLEPEYTVKASEERIDELVSFIEKNLEGTDVLENFIEEQRLWKLYKEKHLQTIFPDYIDGVKMLWGSELSYRYGEEVLVLNIERIKVLESYIARKSGTDGEGNFKEYVQELRFINQQ